MDQRASSAARAAVAPLVKSAPAHLLSRLTAQGAPVGATSAAARSDAAPVGPVVRESKMGKVVEMDGVLAEKAREIRDSKEPVVMSRVDKVATEKFGRLDGFTRTLAAQKIAEEDHPHLVPSAR